MEKKSRIVAIPESKILEKPLSQYSSYFHSHLLKINIGQNNEPLVLNMPITVIFLEYWFSFYIMLA